MNPTDTNPTTNRGDDGVSDLSGMTGAGMMSDNGMTMSDSLDSARDNLTSAGMAAKPLADGVPMGMDEVGKPSATMTPPETPLEPVAPMPGSIGSVSSGPMPGTTNLATAVAPTGVDTGGTALNMASPVAGAPVPGTGLVGANSPSGPVMPTVENTNLIAQAANEAPTSGVGYNPFATPNPSRNAGAQPINASNIGTSQSSMQPVQQPATNSPFQSRLNAMAGRDGAGKNKNVLTLVFAGIAILAVVAAIIFFMLWMQAKNNPVIKYVTTSGTEGTTPPESADATTTVCTKTLAPADLGMANVLDANETVTLTFGDNAWQNYDLYAVYNFTDVDSANAANGSTFAAMASNLVPTADGATVSAGSSQVIDNHVDYRENFAIIPGGVYGAVNVPTNEDGTIQTDPEAVRNYYTERGYTCE